MPRRSISRLSLRLASMAVAALVLGTTSTAGVPYWWCAPMAQAQTTHCCAHEDELGDGDAHAKPPECCSHRRIAALPTSVDVASAVDVGACGAAPVATAAALPEYGAPAVVTTTSEARGPPRGPPTPLYALHRRYLT